MNKELINKLRKAFPKKIKGNELTIDIFGRDLIQVELTEAELKELFADIKSSKCIIDITPDKSDDPIDEVVDYLKDNGIDVMNMKEEILIEDHNGEISVSVKTDSFESMIPLVNTLKGFKSSNGTKIKSVNVVTE